jgi:hypothetical protein
MSAAGGEEPVQRWVEAYNRVLANDTLENRSAYTLAYIEAYKRRECMVCGRSMDRPHLRRQLDPRTHIPIGPDLLAHRECLDKQVREAGFDPGDDEPVGVDPQDSALISNTPYERRQGPDVVIVQAQSGGFLGICRVCDARTSTRSTPEEALSDLRAHVKNRHGRDIEGDWQR